MDQIQVVNNNTSVKRVKDHISIYNSITKKKILISTYKRRYHHIHIDKYTTDYEKKWGEMLIRIDIYRPQNESIDWLRTMVCLYNIKFPNR
jgi:hypothetical protein